MAFYKERRERRGGGTTGGVDGCVLSALSRWGGSPPILHPQEGFAATWTRSDRTPLKYTRVKASNGTYVFKTKDQALGAGVADAMVSLGGDGVVYISGQPSPDPDPKAMFASVLADLQDRLQSDLLEPFAEAIAKGDQGRIEAYRSLANGLRKEIDALENSLAGK